jgi:putative membrane protein
MRIFGFIFFLLILFLGATFAVMNAQDVTINYYIGTNKLPLSLLLVIVLGAGGFIGWLAGFWMWISLKAENLRHNYRIKSLEKELSHLRTHPVNDSH